MVRQQCVAQGPPGPTGACGCGCTGFAYAAVFATGTTGSIEVIDPATRQVIESFPTNNTSDVAVNPSRGELYAAGGDGVDILDVNTGEAVGHLGSYAEKIAFNPVNGKLYVYTGSAIDIYDTRSRSLLASVPASGQVTGMEVDPATNRVYVANTPDVLVINGNTNASEGAFPLTDPGTLHFIAIDPARRRLYVTNTGGSGLAPYEVRSYGLDTRQLLATGTLAAAATDIASDPKTNLVYAAQYLTGTAALDGDTLESAGAIGAAGSQLTLDQKNNILYSNDYAQINATDTATEQPLFTVNVPEGDSVNALAVADCALANLPGIPGPTGPTGPAPGPCVPQNLAYVLQAYQVSVVDTEDNEVIRTLPLPEGAAGRSIAANAAEGLLYVGTNTGVLSMDAETGQVENQVNYGSPVGYLAYDPRTNKLYAAVGSYPSATRVLNGDTLGQLNQVDAYGQAVIDEAAGLVYLIAYSGYSSLVYVLRASDDSLVTTLPISGNFNGIALDAAGHRLFVRARDQLDVIDTRTNTVINTFAVPFDSNTGVTLAYSPVTNQLFFSSYTGAIYVLNADNGQTEGTVSTATFNDLLAYDNYSDQLFYIDGPATGIIDASTLEDPVTLPGQPRAFAFARIECPTGPTGPTGE